uniref:DUF3778 domain-containing protein n=1 Tax=Oryza nivara TaxID=4536 RepID=A0A0E0HQJ3_ORYNI
MEVGDSGGVTDVAKLGDGDTNTTEDDGGGADPVRSDGGGLEAVCSGGGGSEVVRGSGGCSDAGGWIWDPSSSLSPGSGIHAGCAIWVELKLLRFNGELHGEVWLSPVKPTPKSTAQQQISNLCNFYEGDRRGLLVRQAVCMLKETQGCNRRGFAAAPCRFAPSALPSFRRLFMFLVQFSILCILLFLLTMFGGLPS